jgi:hypothetical protein
VAAETSPDASGGVMETDSRGEHSSPTRPLAHPVPVLIVVAIGGIVIVAAIASVLRRPPVPAVISEDYSRVAASLLTLEVRGQNPAFVAQTLNGLQPALAVRLPSLQDAGYVLEGGAIRTLAGHPGVIAIYRNRAMDLLVAHAYQGSVAELPGPPEVRRVDNRQFVIHRKAANILVFWQDGPVVMVVTSSLPVEQVVKLAVGAARDIDSAK